MASSVGMLIRHRGAQPTVDPSAYVAPNATLVGDVRVGPRARIMYGATLDAEGAHIEIGEACVIAENAVLQIATKWQADLLVVGMRCLNPFARWWRKSPAERLIDEVPMNVVAVPCGSRR